MPLFLQLKFAYCINREQQRQRKRHFKSEFVLFQTSWLLFHFIQFVKCGVDSVGLYLSIGEEEGNCFLVLTSFIKHETKKFHVVVVLQRHRYERKCVMRVRSCCFANLNLLPFLTFLLSSLSFGLKLPNISFRL